MKKNLIKRNLKFILFIIILIYYFVGISCNHLEKHNKGDVVKVKAKIVEFIPRADHIDFDGGHSTSYDATLLSITSPIELKEKKMYVYRLSVDKISAEGKKWQSISKELEFTINKQFIEKGECFEGVISNIKWF